MNLIMLMIYSYCGDLNSRVGKTDDFIETVDEIPVRSVDFDKNYYGDRLNF